MTSLRPEAAAAGRDGAPTGRARTDRRVRRSARGRRRRGRRRSARGCPSGLAAAVLAVALLLAAGRRRLRPPPPAAVARSRPSVPVVVAGPRPRRGHGARRRRPPARLDAARGRAGRLHHPSPVGWSAGSPPVRSGAGELLTDARVIGPRLAAGLGPGASPPSRCGWRTRKQQRTSGGGPGRRARHPRRAGRAAACRRRGRRCATGVRVLAVLGERGRPTAWFVVWRDPGVARRLVGAASRLETGGGGTLPWVPLISARTVAQSTIERRENARGSHDFIMRATSSSSRWRSPSAPRSPSLVTSSATRSSTGSWWPVAGVRSTAAPYVNKRSSTWPGSSTRVIFFVLTAAVIYSRWSRRTVGSRSAEAGQGPVDPPAPPDDVVC